MHCFTAILKSDRCCASRTDQFFYELAQQRSSQAPYRDRRIQLLIVHEPDRSRFVVHDDGSGFDTSRVDRPLDPERSPPLQRARTSAHEVVHGFRGFQSSRQPGDVDQGAESSTSPVPLIATSSGSDQGDSPSPRRLHRCLQTRSGRFANRDPTSRSICPWNGENRSLALLSAVSADRSPWNSDFYKQLLDQSS